VQKIKQKHSKFNLFNNILNLPNTVEQRDRMLAVGLPI